MVLLFLIPFFLLDIRIVNFICSDLCDFAIQTIHAPSFQMYTPFIRKFHVIQYHYSHASCCVYNMLYTYIRTISIFSTITEYSSVFWHHGEINYSFGRYRIFTRPYIPILFQRPILFNLSRNSWKQQKFKGFNNISNISRKILLPSYMIFSTFLKFQSFFNTQEEIKNSKNFAHFYIIFHQSPKIQNFSIALKNRTKENPLNL